MASRVPWVGLTVGAAVGAAARAGLVAVRFPGSSQENYTVWLYVAVVGAVVGALAGATGRAVRGAVVGAGISVLFSLITLPFLGLASYLGAAVRLPTWWELLVSGGLPGAVGGWAEHLARRRRERNLGNQSPRSCS